MEDVFKRRAFPDSSKCFASDGEWLAQAYIKQSSYSTHWPQYNVGGGVYVDDFCSTKASSPALSAESPPWEGRMASHRGFEDPDPEAYLFDDLHGLPAKPPASSKGLLAQMLSIYGQPVDEMPPAIFLNETRPFHGLTTTTGANGPKATKPYDHIPYLPQSTRSLPAPSMKPREPAARTKQSHGQSLITEPFAAAPPMSDDSHYYLPSLPTLLQPVPTPGPDPHAACQSFGSPLPAHTPESNDPKEPSGLQMEILSDPKATAREAASSVAHCTTVMLRNIPNKYTQVMLVECLKSDGFQNDLDFLYLPVDFKNKCNVGYAFLNFRTNEACGRFAAEYHCKSSVTKLPGFRSKKVCEVMPAVYQGREENIKRLLNSPVMKQLSVHPEWLPMLFNVDGEAEDFPLALQSQGPQKRQTRK